MSALGELRLVLLTAMAAVLLGSLLGTAGTAALLRRQPPYAPASRRRILLLAGASPLALAGAVFAAALLPAMRRYLQPAADHCLHHRDDHAHLCFVHWPAHVGGLASWAFVWGFLAVTAQQLTSAMLAMRRALSLLAVLRTQASPSSDGRTWCLPHDRPVALTAGFWRPWVVLSTGLLMLVSPAELAVITAHEEAHARSRDVLLQWFLRGASWPLWPSVRRRLIDALGLACEQPADEEAAVAVGDRLMVAEAILAVHRLRLAASPQLLPAIAFAPRHVERRVEALMGDPLPTRPIAPLFATLVALGAGVLLASEPIHHMIESFLGVLSP